MDKRYSAPIKSKAMIKSVSNALNNLHPSYRILFLLIVETGVRFNYATTLKVKDLQGAKDFSFTLHDIVYTTELSKELRSYIDDYASGLAPNEFMFKGLRSNKPLMPKSFAVTLAVASEICGIFPNLNINSLRKTYIYFLALQDMNKAMEFASLPSVRQMYEYLHMEHPDENKNRIAAHSTKQEFIQSDLLGFTHRKITNAFTEISRVIEDIENVDVAYFHDVQQFLADLDATVDHFTAKHPIT